MNWLGILCFVTLFCSSSGLRDRLLDAVHIADVETVRNLLIEMESGILTSNAPVSVVQTEKTHGRTSLLHCGLDPQMDDIGELDNKCIEIAKLLKAHGANLSHVDTHGWNAISFASVKGLSKYVRYLIENGVALDEPDEDLRTPLIKATAHGFKDTVDILISNGAIVTSQDKLGLTALHYAVRQSIAESTFIDVFYSVLNGIKHGNQLDIRDLDGRTPLMYAAAGGSLEIVDTLLLKGSDSRLYDNKRQDSLMLATTSDIRNRLTAWNIRLTLQDHEKWLKESEFVEDDL